MKVKNEISEELRSLSTVIDEISRGTTYMVPAGYFIDLPGFVMKRIQQMGQNASSAAGIPGDEVLPSLLPEKGEASPFQVPVGYFEGLAGGIMDRIKKGQSGDVAEELAGLSPLLSRIGREMPYQAPEGYFDGLAPVLAGLQDKPLYKVPEGYFDGLAGEIAARVKQSVSAVAESSVPGMEKPAPAKVVTMGRNRGWWRYSAAAVVAALVLTIGWLRLHVSGHAGNGGTMDIANNLVKVSDQDIQSYLDNDNNVNAPLAEAVTNSTATLDMDDSDVKSLLGDVPDGELKQYMEEHGGAKDVATN